MKTNINSNTTIITLSTNEFWYLAKIFGPGLVFGVEDPTIGFSKEEQMVADSEAITSLMQAGVINFDGENQIKMDELLGAMIYSCIHSSNVLVTNSRKLKLERFYYFLPNWQLELSCLNKDYQLTLLKDKEDVFQHIISTYKFELSSQGSEQNPFSLYEKDLEMAVSLYESENKEQALKILKKNTVGDNLDIDKFLVGYTESQQNLLIKMIYDRNLDYAHQCKYELIKINNILYWLSYETTPGDDPVPIIHFIPISDSEVKSRFLRMLPK